MPMGFIRRRTVMTGTVALLGALLFPTQAFACWYSCTAKYGFRRSIDGEQYVLQSCYQTWPEGANGPITTCVYGPA